MILQPSHKNPKLHAVLILCAGTLAHLMMLRRGFVWDDTVLRNHQDLAGHWRLFSPDSFGFIRPGKTFLFSLLESLFGDSPIGPQSLALVVLLATALLLYRFALRLVTPTAALVAALIYAVHPLHVEATGWLSALNGTLIVALALVYYTILLDERKPLQASTAAALTFIFALALLIKEDAIVIPAIGLLCLWYKQRTPGRPLLAAVAIQFLLAAAFVLWTRHASQAGGQQLEIMVYNDLMTSLHAPWMTILHSLYFAVPFPWLYYHYYAPPLSLFILLTLLGWILFAALAVFAFRRRRNFPLPLFALLFAVVALAPACNFLPLHNSWFGVRYLAHAGVPLALLAGWLLARPLECKSPLARAALAAWLLAAVVVSARDHHVWRSDDTLFAMMVRNDDSPLMHAAYANRLFHAGNYAQAETVARRSVELGHPRINAHVIVGMAMLRQGRAQEAVQLWHSLLPADPTNVDLAMNLAYYYDESFSHSKNPADLEQADKFYAIAAAGSTANAEAALVNRGILWAANGNDQKGAAIWQEGLSRFPNSPKMTQYLAIAQKNLAAVR